MSAHGVTTPFLGSPGLGRVLKDLRFLCIDLGARGGVDTDWLPLARSVDAVGFEPDETECKRLNQAAARDPGPWHSLRYVPTAISEHGGPRTLHLAQHRGSRTSHLTVRCLTTPASRSPSSATFRGRAAWIAAPKLPPNWLLAAGATFFS